MTIRTIDDGVLNSPEAEAYFTTKADRRVLIGFRAALEMLAIPLAAELDAIKRQIDRALVDEDKAKEDAFIAGIKDVRITEGDARENLIRRTFTVHVTRTGNDGQRDWETTAEKTGLTSLRAEEYAWLLRHPERIPASILALADDPRTAFQTYFGGKKRGYFRGA